MIFLKTFESHSNNSSLIIVDVQKSFREFFTEMYLNELNKYSKGFSDVYQIWDNHIEGKNVDKDYLYDDKPDKPVNGDLYFFPNQKDLIEKRYNYDVNVDFYKKILNEDVYNGIKQKEESKTLKKGELFETNKGTAIVFIGNNHQWFHIGNKLYSFLKSQKGKLTYIVGGSDSECLEDIFVAATTIGVNIKRDWKYIYSANHCPIK